MQEENCVFTICVHNILTFILSSSLSLPSPTLCLSKNLLPSTLWGEVSSYFPLVRVSCFSFASFKLGGKSWPWLVQHHGGMWWLLFHQHAVKALCTYYTLCEKVRYSSSNFRWGNQGSQGSVISPKTRMTSMLRPCHCLSQPSWTFHFAKVMSTSFLPPTLKVKKYKSFQGSKFQSAPTMPMTVKIMPLLTQF